jgi:type I restriction enzyme, R subunit
MNGINEEKTRKSLIDDKLKEAGWIKIIPYSENLNLSELHLTAVEELPTESGPADYGLFLNGKPVGIVEAKKLSLGPQNVLVQAQRYAKGIDATEYNFGGYKVPFIYSTNGEVIWFQDLRKIDSRSRRLAKFHTPSALIDYLNVNLDEKIQWLKDNPPLDPRLRDYQREAVLSIEEAIRNSKRSMLVAMATGTGKTFTTASLMYRLLKSGTSKRILFLVDRKALAAQSVMEFASYNAENNLKFNQIYQVYSQKFQQNSLDDKDKFDFNVLPNSYLTDPSNDQVFVYVCTIQRMRINLFGSEGMFPWSDDVDQEEDLQKLDIPIHAFDTIIADECHRGYTSQEMSKWREVLDHFDAIKIGLTATPAAHTTGFFKDIVYRYTYPQAVNDGFLVDYDAVKIESGVRIEGITLNEGDEVQQIDPETGAQQLDLLEDERVFSVTDVERKITAPDSNRKIIQEFAHYALEQEKETGRFPKTLIFADNDLAHTSHADQIVDICRDVFNRGDQFVQKITGSPTVDRPLQKIKEFRNRPEPHIVVTVDMLSTGVDIPSIENIIFLRPVKSRILFEQMMGRGTRLCKSEDFPNNPGTEAKTHFTIFDCFGGTLLEAFKNSTGITEDTPAPPTRKIEEIIQDINNNVEVDYNLKCLIRRFQRIDKNISAEGRQWLSKYMLDGDIGEFAKKLFDNFKTNRAEVMSILNDPDFIKLIKDYPKADKKFIVASDHEDYVNSEYLFRTSDGRELKPSDYIECFERFVKDNPEHIEALNILLSKPKSWSTEALKELRESFKQRPEHFTETNLRRAYKYPLADIISMVKHAAKDEPLLSARERVDLAVKKVMSDGELTPKQMEWLELIKLHLVENLTLDPEDFDNMPVFINNGGSFKNIDKDFNFGLMSLIQRINSTIPTVYDIRS